MKTVPDKNAPDPLEVRIAAVPRREIPLEWKALILGRVKSTEAKPAVLDAGKTRAAGVGWYGLRQVVHRLGLWPALGGVWVAVAAAQLSLPKAHSTLGDVTHPPEDHRPLVATETIRQIHDSLAQLMQREPAPSQTHPTPLPHLLYYRERSRQETEFLS